MLTSAQRRRSKSSVKEIKTVRACCIRARLHCTHVRTSGRMWMDLHRHDESSVCAGVSINEVACYRTKRALMGCADPPPPLLRGSAHPISVLDLTEQKQSGCESMTCLLLAVGYREICDAVDTEHTLYHQAVQ